jgi:uncharacterized protein
MNEPAETRFETMTATLRRLPGAVIAFSGGVDSTVLLHAATAALGRDRVVAVTASSPSLPASELAAARRVAAEIGVRHVVVATDELARDGYARNGPDRCFHCKSELFDVIPKALGPAEAGWPVMIGAIADDALDHRPGARAAAERGVLTPLADAGLGKDDVRAYGLRHGLSTARKPASACLASRVPYGTPIDAALLGRIERAEEALRGLGFDQLRVRHHGELARIEVPPDELGRVLERREDVLRALRPLGWVWVSLDLAGYRSGSMNEVLA